ncbi:MAG: cupin domain-containing protein [Erysipelotrichaceae bacterium]|nr:cupin domain-containing protein [Erysipelotrichaceae bacterium]
MSKREERIHIVLLSGGSGQRLWPLSNDIRAKQFIPYLKREDGQEESMLQRTFCQIRNNIENAQIHIVTQKNQVSQIKQQIGDDVDIIVEPKRRGTFHAVLLASMYLRDVRQVGEEEPVIFCPVDPYVEDGYYRLFEQLYDLVKQRKTLTLLGIRPTYPSGKYGYMIPQNGEKVSDILSFKEKPTEAQAKDLIDQHALWNAGVFAFPIKELLGKYAEGKRYQGYLDHYGQLIPESFDYAVLEKESKIRALRYEGVWKDIGTWNTFTEVAGRESIGYVIASDNTENTHIINQLDIPVVVNGIRDAVVVATREGVLVSDKGQSSYIKPLVDQVDHPVMIAEKSWGRYEVIDLSEESLTIKVTLHPGHSMNYHSHQYREEIWNVIEGRGTVIVDGVCSQVGPGDIISLPVGCKHTVRAKTELKIIEVQLGKDISVEDKEKYPLDPHCFEGVSK